MPIGKLAVHYALKNHINVKILVPDSGIGFPRSDFPANTYTNRAATFIKNSTNAKNMFISG